MIENREEIEQKLDAAGAEIRDSDKYDAFAKKFVTSKIAWGIRFVRARRTFYCEIPHGDVLAFSHDQLVQAIRNGLEEQS